MKFENTFTSHRLANTLIENVVSHRDGSDGSIGQPVLMALMTSFEGVIRSKNVIQGDKSKISQFMRAEVVPVLLGTFTGDNAQKAVIVSIPSNWGDLDAKCAIRDALVKEFEVVDKDFSPIWCLQGYAEITTLDGKSLICNIHTTYFVCDEDRDVLMSLDRVTA